MGVIDIRPYRLKEFQAANLTMADVDERLLNECAYYPLPANPFFDLPSKCLKCTFSKPNPKCKYSHILSLTPASETKRDRLSGDVKRLLGGVSEEDLTALREWIKTKKEKYGSAR